MTLSYQTLLGREFIYGEQDCYSLVRDFFLLNFQLDLPNYARPDEFWKHDMDMYLERYRKHGFELIDCHPSQYEPADVFLMAINSKVANHAAILVEGGQIIHHLWNRLSTKERYGGIWRNTTVAVLRHKDVVVEKTFTTTDISQHLSKRTLEKLNALRSTS